ncbi:hypothetical protein [Hydrogenophilus thermoluteolus]|uniref:hypothetical protein n=1 Tax=Hydrogenophilus thermoluteolus TaxID=297 RepID=UPI003F6735FB
MSRRFPPLRQPLRLLLNLHPLPPEGTTTESTLSARHCRGAYCVTTAIAEPLWLDHTLQEARPRWTVEGVLLALFIFALTRLQVVHGKLKRALVTQQRLARPTR